MDLCEDIATFTLESTGALGTGGASIKMTTGVPPCESQHSATDEYTPNGCYSEVSFELDPDRCLAADAYYPDQLSLGGCPPLYLGPGYGPQLQAQDCSAAFDGIYVDGFNWPSRGPAALTSCVFSRTGPIYDGLVGPTWFPYEASLTIEYSDRPAGDVPFDIIRNKGYVSVDGQLRERDPQAYFDTVQVAAPDQYAFNDRSVAAYGDSLTSYQWEFQKLPPDIFVASDDDWVTLGTASGRFPTFTFTDADDRQVVRAKLTVTDGNGRTASETESFLIYRGGGGGPVGDVPIVTVEATDDQASESGGTGTWTLTRSTKVGQLAVDVSQSGSATEGVDYGAIADQVTFPNGVDEVQVTLTPIADALVEGPETATLTIDQGTGYKRGDPYQGTITIIDATTLGTTTPGTTTPGTTTPGTTTPGTTTPPAVVGCIGTATVAAGASIPVCGDGFLPGEQVLVFLHSAPVQLTVVTADANGTARATVTVPATTAAGSHRIEMRGVTSGLSLFSAPFTVTAGDGAATLPRTGASSGGLALIGVTLVIAGFGFMRSRRRWLSA